MSRESFRMMRIVPASGSEFELSIHGVGHTSTIDHGFKIVKYRGSIAVYGFRFNVSIHIGDHTLPSSQPHKVWVHVEPDLSDPAVGEELRRATVQARKRGFVSARSSMNFAFECLVCGKTPATIDRFRRALLLSDSADISVYSAITVAARASGGIVVTDLYDLCLIHGAEVYHKRGSA